ncbi:MAG: hypothetical protein V4615_04655 [Bacteroidota bacterium]
MTTKIRATILTGLFLLASLTSIHAQQVQTVPTPDFPNELMLWVDSSNTLVSVPVEKGEKKEEASAYLNVVFGVLKTPNSPLRLSSGKSYLIVFKHSPLYLSSPNPKDVYKLIKFKIDEKKKYRSCTIRYTSVTEKASKKGQAYLDKTIDVVFKKLYDDVYSITLDNLEQGEYVFPISEYKMFTFGVDYIR